MTPEVLRFLQQFAEPIELGVAAHNVFGVCFHPAAPQWVIESIRGGYMELGWKPNGERDTDPVVDSRRIYSRMFVLTDAGLVKYNLPPRKTPIVRPKVKTLFDMEG